MATTTRPTLRRSEDRDLLRVCVGTRASVRCTECVTRGVRKCEEGSHGPSVELSIVELATRAHEGAKFRAWAWAHSIEQVTDNTNISWVLTR
jgi:hypothetical protein